MTPQDIYQKRILFAALNWGLGHVMRAIPLIKMLQQSQNTIVIACSEGQQKLFEQELEGVDYVEHADYPFVFNGKGRFTWDILRQFPSLLTRLRKEKEQVEKMIAMYAIDLVISDQRLGFYSEHIPSILVTHQVQLPVKGLAKSVLPFYQSLLKKFTLIWIPDNPSPDSLSGRLSHSTRMPTRYIGILSRFEPIENVEKLYDFGAIISGPPPYNQQFFEYLKKEFSSFPIKCYIVFNEATPEKIGNLEIFSSLDAYQMGKIIQQTKTVVSRSGYSTLMDLKKLNAKAYLIPTPGQFEQLYLHKHLVDNPQLGVLVSHTEQSFIETYILQR